MNDYQTSTVDGAAGFEKMYGNNEVENDYPNEADLIEDDAEEDDYNNWYRCGCSDPGCPCEGRKIGTWRG